MFNSRKKKSFWSQLFETEREDRFTIQELGFLHEVLDSNARVHEGNKDTVVEALRSIAELMIWGDQHDASFFEFFAEHHTLSYFRRILSQAYCRSGEVAVQILQTLSILTQNIQSEQAIYFLFSNNHVNQIIMQDFNFKDDEVLGYYISFLKTISLKLNAGTVQFFFLKKRIPSSGNSQSSAAEDGSQSLASAEFEMEFPFYNRITQFFRHEESMVRAAVRTCTLNIYSVKDEGVRHFLRNAPEANAYIVNLGKYVMEQCQALSVILPATRQGTIDPKRLDVALEDLDDIFYYCHDVYTLFEQGVGEKLMCVLWEDLHSIVFDPFKTSDATDDAEASDCGAARVNSTTLTVSLLILERLFHILHIPGLLNAVFASMFLPKPRALKLAPLIWSSSAQDPQEGSSEAWYDVWPVFKQCIADDAMHIESRLCVRFLAKCIKNSKMLDEDIMDAAGLLPRKVKTSRMLFNELTSIDPPPRSDSFHSIRSDNGVSASTSTEEEPSSNGSELLGKGGKKGHRRAASSEEVAHLQLFPEEDQGPSLLEAGLTNLPDGREAAPVFPSEPPGDDAADARGKAEGEEKIDEAPYLIIGDLIAAEPFQVDVVNLVGWVLYQWLPLGQRLPSSSSETPKASDSASEEKDREAVFSPRKASICGLSVPEPLANVLNEQMKRCVEELSIHLQHSWCDGIPLLISKAWKRNKRHLISPHVSMNAVETALFLLQSQRPTNTGQRTSRGVQPNDPGMSTAIVAARRGNQAVNAFVAIAQLKLWLETGDLPNDPSALFGLDKCCFGLDEPVGLVPHERRPLPVCDGTDIDLSSMNLFDNAADLKVEEAKNGPNFLTGALPCRVAFTRGAERNVFFCLDGRHAVSASGHQKHSGAQGDLGSVCIFLADANEETIQPRGGLGRFARVVAMAPLAGAEPAIDPTHPSWLHLRVRPPLSAFTAICNMMNASAGQAFGHKGAKKPKLNDGRWTLAFEDADSAKKAERMVDMQRKHLRANAHALLRQFNPPQTSV